MHMALHKWIKFTFTCGPSASNSLQSIAMTPHDTIQSRHHDIPQNGFIFRPTNGNVVLKANLKFKSYTVLGAGHPYS